MDAERLAVSKQSDALTESAPERIWLQVDTNGDADDRSEPIKRENWSDLTWCYDSIGGQEVIYIRADLAEATIATLTAEREALRDRLLAVVAAHTGDNIDGCAMTNAEVDQIATLAAKDSPLPPPPMQGDARWSF